MPPHGGRGLAYGVLVAEKADLVDGLGGGYHPTYASGSEPYTSPVGSFSPNGYGLYDMAGSMWEWCWDRLGNYPSTSQTDPRGPASGSDRVYRGGGWYALAFHCRVAGRGSNFPTASDYSIGFRVARSSVP